MPVERGSKMISTMKIPINIILIRNIIANIHWIRSNSEAMLLLQLNDKYAPLISLNKFDQAY